MKTDDGISPIVAIALLIGLVVIAGAIIGLTMLAELDDAAGIPPDVQFHASADDKRLYHAGGDVLYMDDLIFYNTANKADISGSVEKNGPSNIWETGEWLTLPIGMTLDTLSIVGLDSRNHQVILYMGSMVQPEGDMVPDEWPKPTPTTPTPVPTTPTPVPTPPEVDDPDLGDSPFHSNQETFTFDGRTLIAGTGNNVPLIKTLNHTADNGSVDVFMSTNNNNQKIIWFSVTVYNENGVQVFPESGSNMQEVTQKNPKTVTIPADKLRKGYVCHVTIELRNDNAVTYRHTVVITVI